MARMLRRAVVFTGIMAVLTTSVKGAEAQSTGAGSPSRDGTIPDPSYPFVVPPLPYHLSHNEPYIDALTMELHHDKHHAHGGQAAGAEGAGLPKGTSPAYSRRGLGDGRSSDGRVYPWRVCA